MNLTNATKMVAGYTLFTDKHGREHLVVVTKGTFGIPLRTNDVPVLLEKQLPLISCDEFTGEPGISAPLYEIDYSGRKPRCDVLLHGKAYAPGGKATERVTVGLKVGSVNKSFDVVGNRLWKVGTLYKGPSAIQPFVTQSISYDVAFGGVDRTSQDPAQHRWYLLNHAGRGYFTTSDPKALDGKPLPNTEETGRPITSTTGNYKPMAFGPVGRSWQPRIKWAGTYDQKWLDQRCPFLPEDFDERYFQSAPEDQQTDYLQGGEEVVLSNLTPAGLTRFFLPGNLQLPVSFRHRNEAVEDVPSVASTLLVEPEANRFQLIWHASTPIQRTIREVTSIVVGMTSQEWEEAHQRKLRQIGKKRLSSFAELNLIKSGSPS